MEKNNARYLVVGIIITMIVAITGVTYAYWRGQIQGEGANMIVSFGKARVIFTDDIEIREDDAKPGWSTTKTFTIENEGDSPFKYDIYIKDLVNTLVTEGFLQYKITSTNGYNMTEYLPIEKSSVATDFDLKKRITIEGNTTQEYTIEIRYVDSEEVDQSEDMGKTFSGQLMIREADNKETLYGILTDGNKYPIVNTRTSFDEVIGTEEATTGVIYKESTYKENGLDVYYFAGNVSDNWVKFADFYFRIIRTNEDGTVRLLYAGTSPDTTSGYVGNLTYDVGNEVRNMGYMYGEEGALADMRKNATSSNAKIVVDNWYKDNIDSNYSEYVSETAIYCNDRSGGGDYYGTSATKKRLENKKPSYKCGVDIDGTLFNDADIADKFSKSSASGGNGDLTYPVGLITADEIAFAGGKINSNNKNTYYYLNSIGGSVTGSGGLWTMSPSGHDGYGGYGNMFYVNSDSYFSSEYVAGSHGIRPVISLKSEVLVSSGDGTSENPYLVELS